MLCLENDAKKNSLKLHLIFQSFDYLDKFSEPLTTLSNDNYN